jgi:hypothetical protein
MAKRRRCVATTAEGRRCRRPGTVPDPIRGGRACWQHDRSDRFAWTSEDQFTITPAAGEEET